MSNLKPAQRSLKDYLGLMAKGFCMGASDVIPGVSGGTMAFILGIYEELIASITSFDLVFAKKILSGKFVEAFTGLSWQFLLAVGSGILIAIFSLAKILSWLLHNQPILIWSFFFGLIVASVFTVSRYIKEWSPATLIFAGFGAVSSYLLVGIVPVNTPEAPWFLFCSGAIAICAMILPGISGAFILVLLGKYHFILDALHQREFFPLIMVALGAGVGLLSFVRLLNWLFAKFHDPTIAILAGLMFGSLRKVWPWKESLGSVVDMHGKLISSGQINVLPAGIDTQLMIAFLLAITGFTVVIALEYFSNRTKS